MRKGSQSELDDDESDQEARWRLFTLPHPLTAVFVCKSLICMRHNITHAVDSVQISYGTLFNLRRMKSSWCIMRRKLFMPSLPSPLSPLVLLDAHEPRRRPTTAARSGGGWRCKFFESRRACFLTAEINFPTASYVNVNNGKVFGRHVALSISPWTDVPQRRYHRPGIKASTHSSPAAFKIASVSLSSFTSSFILTSSLFLLSAPALPFRAPLAF